MIKENTTTTTNDLYLRVNGITLLNPYRSPQWRSATLTYWPPLRALPQTRGLALPLSPCAPFTPDPWNTCETYRYTVRQVTERYTTSLMVLQSICVHLTCPKPAVVTWRRRCVTLLRAYNEGSCMVCVSASVPICGRDEKPPAGPILTCLQARTCLEIWNPCLKVW